MKGYCKSCEKNVYLIPGDDLAIDIIRHENHHYAPAAESAIEHSQLRDFGSSGITFRTIFLALTEFFAITSTTSLALTGFAAQTSKSVTSARLP